MTAFAHLSGGFGSLPAPEGLCPPLTGQKWPAAALGGQRPESPPLLQLRALVLSGLARALARPPCVRSQTALSGQCVGEIQAVRPGVFISI
jgi:hypothetical protein